MDLRIYFGLITRLPALTNSKGLNTGAAKGVIGMIRKLVADYAGDQVVVIFDAKGPTFRNEIYSEYKANRPPMPDELREQIEPIHRNHPRHGVTPDLHWWRRGRRCDRHAVSSGGSRSSDERLSSPLVIKTWLSWSMIMSR